MATCPNKNLESWKLLISSRGDDMAYYLWDKYDGEVPNAEMTPAIVKFNLKALDILNSDKAIQVFEKGKKNGWDINKILTELQVPKEQKQIILSKNISTREEIITSLLAENSFTVEVNVGVDGNKFKSDVSPENIKSISLEEYNSIKVEEIENGTNKLKPVKNGMYFKNKKGDTFFEPTVVENSSFYRDLTVPGGANYTENEISTPAITPNIKSHAQFSTDNGIGWFRSDEQLNDLTDETKFRPVYSLDKIVSYIEISTGLEYNKNSKKQNTRRILEVQSDLFQKGRDKKSLVNSMPEKGNYKMFKYGDFNYFTVDNKFFKQPLEDKNDPYGVPKEIEINKSEYDLVVNKEIKENNFLQLLNKKGNWVNFFIQSIVQDSVKKGYEKVLFPTGETAAKVEGHQTLVEDIAKWDKIINKDYKTWKLEAIDNNLDEINENVWKGNIIYAKNKKEELKTQGIEKLKPIEAFYTNTVTNILNKLYDVNEITDEHGNTWNEVTLDQSSVQGQNILLQKENQSSNKTKASQEILSKVKLIIKRMGIDIQTMIEYSKNNPNVDVTNVNGLADLINGIIAISEGKEDIALTEEMVHIATAIIEQKNPKLITEMISKVDRFKVYKETFEQYKDIAAYQLPNGKPNIRKIKKEAVDKLIADLIINDGQSFSELTEEENRSIIRRMWDAITDWFRGQHKASNIDLFQESATRIILGNFEGNVLDLTSKEVYYQATDAQKKLQQKIIETRESLRKIESKEPINPLLMDEEGATSYYEVLVDGEYQRVTKRVTDRVKAWYTQRFGKNKDWTAQEKRDNEVKRQLGVDFHNYFEEIHDRFFNTDGTRRENFGPRPNIQDATKDAVYTKLEKYYVDLISQFSRDGKNPLVFSEVMVYDPKLKEAGTIDLLIVDQDGTSHIYDWKFMSVAQGAEDVAWYKQGAYNVQLGRYKDILRSAYGVKQIGKNRAVPIIMDLQRENPKDLKTNLKIKGIKIGSVNPKEIQDLKLVPVSEESESTGIKKLDELLVKLNGVYKQITKDKPITEEDKTFKRERLNILKKAIRTAQSTLNIAPLVDVIRVMRKEGENIISEYKTTYEGRPATSEDFNDEQLSDFADNIREYGDLASVFQDINIDLKDLIEEKEILDLIRAEAEAIKISLYEIKEIAGEFADKFIGEKNLVTGLTKPEKVVKGLSSLFRGLSDLPLASLKLLYKLANRAMGFANEDALQEVNDLLAIRDKLKARGGDLRKTVQQIYQKSSEGGLVNKLIYRYKREFFQEVDANAEEGRRSRQWLKDNVDLKGYSIEASKILKERLSKINKTYDDGELKEKLLLDEMRKWDVSRKDFNGFNNYVIKRHPLLKWESTEYINLAKDPELFELYNYITKINKKAQSVGYIENKVQSTFLPFVRKTMAESLAWDFSLSSISNFSDNLSVRTSDVGYGNINEVTGEVENSIPKYYTSDFTKGEDGVNDYSDVSEDIFKNMIMYINHMEKYKYMSEIEGQIKLVRSIETFKDHLQTSKFSKVVMDSNGKPIIEKGNADNVKIFDSFLQTVIYGQKYTADNTDIALGDGLLTSIKKGINSVAGKEVYKIGDKPGSLSLIKTIDAMNRAFQLKTLGFEFISGAVNIFGGNIQVATQAGNYFKAREFAKNEMMLVGNRFKNDDERSMFIQLIDKFMPLKDDPTYEKMKAAGMSKLTQQNFSDMLFVFFREPEQHLEKTIFYTLLDNMMVEDGKVVSIREFVKNKYKDRYSSASNFRDSKQSIDAEIESLKKTRSINSTKKLVDGELVIPGLDLSNREELQRLTNLSRSISRNATGNMTDFDTSRMNMSVWTRSMMVFKGWIPKLLDTRFGEFRKIADDFSVEIGEDGMTTGDKYDVGRVRLFGSFLSLNIAKTVKEINDVLIVNDSGILKLDEMYAQYAQSYFERTGDELQMTAEDFNDLIRNNLRNQLKELAILMSLFGATLALGFMEPEDDEDKAHKNFYRFAQRVVDKFTSELMFFYNPIEMKNILDGGIFPAIGLITDVGRFTDHFFMETTGLDWSNTDLTAVEVRKKAQPIKNLMKMLPVSKSLVTYLAISNSKFAKEFDVTIQKQSR